MLPTDEQIQVAAYHLWEERGRIHGRDSEDWHAARKELTYSLNYEPVAEYDLSEPATRVLGQQPIRTCRFCERDSKQVPFGPPTAVFPIVSNSSLLTAAICQECQTECRDPLEDDLSRFWESIRSTPSVVENQSDRCGRNEFTLGAYKSLVASALLLLPEREVPFFLDALEWVSNPDPDADESLFAGICGRAQLVPTDHAAPRASLARRTDDDAPLPYMMACVSYLGATVQIHLPLCSRDEDLAAGSVPLLERPFRHRFARSLLLPLVLPGDSNRLPGRRRVVEC